MGLKWCSSWRGSCQLWYKRGLEKYQSYGHIYPDIAIVSHTRIYFKTMLVITKAVVYRYGFSLCVLHRSSCSRVQSCNCHGVLSWCVHIYVYSYRHSFTSLFVNNMCIHTAICMYTCICGDLAHASCRTDHCMLVPSFSLRHSEVLLLH